MKKRVAILIVLLLCAVASDQSSRLVDSRPPTGPGISPNSSPADIETQLRSIGFVSPNQNNTEEWLRPVDGTTAKVGSGVVTVVFHVTGKAVTCKIPANERFGEVFMQEEGKDRTTLMNQHGCS